MGSIDEIVGIVDEQNNVIGSVPRSEMRARHLRHRSTYILLFNSQGQLYIQKRTMTKDVFPGYYDLATGGVVVAGESYEVGAVRELEEEMGIRNVPLTKLFEFYFEDENNHTWGSAFTCVYDGKLTLQDEEVESVIVLSPEETLRHAESEPYTPDGLYVLRRYLGQVT